MNYLIHQLLNTEEINLIKKELEKYPQDWEDGKKTAGSQASMVKNNLQLNRNSEASKKNSQLVNKKIRDSNLPEDIRIGAIIRDEKVIIPRSNFTFEKNDLVVFLAKREELKAVESIFSLSTI